MYISMCLYINITIMLLVLSRDPLLGIIPSSFYANHTTKSYTQRRVQSYQCYFTVQMTGSNFECSL